MPRQWGCSPWSVWFCYSQTPVYQMGTLSPQPTYRDSRQAKNINYIFRPPTTYTPPLPRVRDCPYMPTTHDRDPRQGPTQADPEKRNHGCAHVNPFSLSEVRGAPPWGVGPAPLHMYRYQYPVRDVFWNGGGGREFFLIFSSGCIPWGRRLDTVKGEGGGWVKCFKAFHPSPPFKVYKGVPLFCGTLGI
mgnify:CR=1 FL=1